MTSTVTKYYLLEHVFLHFKTSSLLVRYVATNREVLINVTAVDWNGKMTSIDFSSFIFYRNNKSLVSKNISARSRSLFISEENCRNFGVEAFGNCCGLRQPRAWSSTKIRRWRRFSANFKKSTAASKTEKRSNQNCWKRMLFC